MSGKYGIGRGELSFVDRQSLIGILEGFGMIITMQFWNSFVVVCHLPIEFGCSAMALLIAFCQRGTDDISRTGRSKTEYGSE